MPKNLEAELEDFIRWLATMPQYRAEFQQNPDKVMDYAQLSEMARSTLHSRGRHAVLEEVQEQLDQILSSPEAQKQSTFNRDRSVSGFGGAVIRKEPKDD